MREISLSCDGKILILSDIHYPHCDVNEVIRIIESEKPSVVVLLGDIIVDNSEYESFLNRIKESGNGEMRRVIYIRGDDDVIEGDYDILHLKTFGKDYTLLHGHQNFNEKSEYNLAKWLKKINRNIPPLLFCLAFKLLTRSFKSTLILGHSHALVYFRGLRCVNAGTLASISNGVYHDRGYVIIDKGEVKLIKL
ncbi:MAG: metallophosphoesterase family protein [Sulfolobaceae archaeon]|nr:metallophosphoesterase family protein [Sulfolobaceae archaeon]